jgi:hypothetical protein
MLQHLELKEGWTTVILLLALLLCVAWSIQAAEWTAGLSILQPAALVGGILGIVLAKSRVPNRLAHLLALLASFTLAVFLTSRVLAGSSELSTEAAVIALDQQIRSWLTVLMSGEESPGNEMFLLLLTFLISLVAYVSAWVIFRWQLVWWAVILCGLAVMPNVTYAAHNLTAYMAVYALLALLLVVRTSLALYQQEWRVARVGYSPDLVFAFLRAGLIVTLAAIFLAWVAPEVLPADRRRSCGTEWASHGGNCRMKRTAFSTI